MAHPSTNGARSGAEHAAHDAVRRLLEEAGVEDVQEHLDPTFIESVLSAVGAASPLQSQEGTVPAHLLHAAMRSFALSDGAPPEDMPVLTAPDLGIDLTESDGATTAGDDRVLATVVLPDASAPTGDLAALRRILEDRRSMPYFSPEPLELVDLATLLESALGSRELVDAYNRRDVPLRRFPSAGGLQPLDVHVMVSNVRDIERGQYRYNPVDRSLVLLEQGDIRVPLVEAVIQTDWIYYAPVVVVLVGRLDRCYWKYGTRGYRYLNVDTGCAYLALHLVAEAMGLFGNPLAAFDDDRMNELLRLDGRDRFANLLFAVGRRPPRWQ